MKRLGLLAIFACSGAWAQEQAPPTPLKSMVDRWDKCFFASTHNQFSKRIDAEANLVAELAFQACATEEEAFMTYLTLGSGDPFNSRAIILRHRGFLKKKIVG